MGRDKGRGKRGGRGGKRFAAQSAEEIEQRNARLAAFDERRAKRRTENEGGDGDEPDDQEREAMLVGMRVARMNMDHHGGGDEDDDDNDPRERKAKGVEGLIEVDNPNLARARGIKIGDLGTEAAAPMTRKQREEAERAAKAAAYRKRHEMGLTEEYKRDMSKLEEVKKRREVAKAKEDAEKEVAAQMEAERKKAEVKAGLINTDDQRDEKKKKKSSSKKSSSSKTAEIEKLDKIAIKKMKPAKLKEELKLRGLEIQGTGKQLTERLLQYEANR